MARIDYQVPGKVYMVRQPDAISCWAAAAAIMMSWRYQAIHDVDAALARAGDTWVKFRATHGRGLYPELIPAFADACGLTAAPLETRTPDGWLELLELCGPLAVVSRPSSYHARVLWGMFGELDQSGGHLRMKVADPESGRWLHEPFRTFAEGVDRAARVPSAWVWHWPPRGPSRPRAGGH